MSLAQQPRTDECTHCESAFDLPNARPNHCSDACYYRDKGAAVLRQVAADHTTCATCYRKLKVLDPITDEECVHGTAYQYPTENATIGVDDTGETDRPATEFTRISCGGCGAVNPNDTHAFIQAEDLAAVIARFYRALERMATKDAIKHPPTRSEYFDALREHPHDAAYAAGRAVYG